MTVPPWNSVPIGQCELVVKCMHRIERMRPPDPAYEQSWNLDVLVNWVESLRPNKQLDLLTLRMKCIILFKLVDMTRSADLLAVSLDLSDLLRKGYLAQEDLSKITQRTYLFFV